MPCQRRAHHDETSAVEFDEVAAAQTSQAKPGPYVCLSVTDTGCGIPPRYCPGFSSLFSPPKRWGKGTGLGLATVFGIVQQLKAGSRFSAPVGRAPLSGFYLPRPDDGFGPESPGASLVSIRGGKEPFCWSRDEAALRAAVRTVLAYLGYGCWKRPAVMKALRVWEQHMGKSAVADDQVMPAACRARNCGTTGGSAPGLKVICTSGYSVENQRQGFS